VTERLDLGAMFSPDVVTAIEQLVDERVATALASMPEANGVSPWLTLEQAAERLGCSTDAVRMRAKRGRLKSRRQGRRVYVSRESVDGLA
jgi:excisionase family DNA binding protein